MSLTPPRKHQSLSSYFLCECVELRQSSGPAQARLGACPRSSVPSAWSRTTLLSLGRAALGRHPHPRFLSARRGSSSSRGVRGQREVCARSGGRERFPRRQTTKTTSRFLFPFGSFLLYLSVRVRVKGCCHFEVFISKRGVRSVVPVL